MPDAAAAGHLTYTLVYDGTCSVCSRIVRAIVPLDRDGVIEIVASQAPGVRERFPWIAPSAFDAELQLVSATRETWSGARAVEQLLRVLPRSRWFAWAFGLPFARSLADWAYGWFARNRYRLGCGAHCKSE